MSSFPFSEQWWVIKGDLKITAHSIVRKKALEEAFQSVLPLALSHDGNYFRRQLFMQVNDIKRILISCSNTLALHTNPSELL